jgi:hypothetical protein
MNGALWGAAVQFVRISPAPAVTTYKQQSGRYGGQCRCDAVVFAWAPDLQLPEMEQVLENCTIDFHSVQQKQIDRKL